MKKFSLFILMLSVFSFLAKAQITDNFENYAAFTVNPTGIWTYYDGDGGQTHSYSSVTVPNLPYTGSCIVMNPSMTDPDITETQGAHSGSQFLAIFNANPEYLGTGATTNDWVISPQMSFTNGGTLSFWARELTDQYGAEVMRVLYSTTDNNPSSFIEIQQVNISSTTWAQYSYSIPAGAKYVAINCISDDIFALFLDDISIQINTSDPTIVAIPNSLNYGYVSVGETATSTVAITGYNLTSSIIASTSAPFSISSDGTNFGTSATLGSTGGTLFVKYSPTTAGSSTGAVTLFSGTAAASVSLQGNGLDCGAARTIPYSCTFAAGLPELNCWETVDIDGDAYADDLADHHGEFAFNGTFSSDNDGIAQYVYNTSMAANDWLISPSIALGINSRASFDYLIASSSYPEIFGVYVIPQGGTYATATAIIAQHTVTNTDWTTQNIDLSAYDNQTVRIAFHVTSAADMWYLAIDNFLVDGDIPPTLTSNVTDIDFGRIRVGTTREEEVILTSTHLNEPITVSTVAPFSVSIDGVNFATTITIPANPAVNVDDIVYVRFAPDSAGAYNEYVTATTSTLSVSIIMKGDAFDCETITEFPFVETFANNSSTRGCWDIDDANSDASTFFFADSVAQYAGDAANTADDWLLSPEIVLTGNQVMMFDFRTPTAATGKFTVSAISSDTTIALSELIEATSNAYETQVFDIRNLTGTYRIGFHCMSDPGDVSLEIDNFTIQELDEPSITATPSEMTFNCFLGMDIEPTEAQTAQIIGINLTEDITASTAAPFEISIDDETYGTEATITATGLATNATLYVRYNPDSEGTHNGVVNLASGTANATITLNGTAESDGIEENASRTIAIYPNPASTILNVEAEGYDNLQIVNMVGQVVYSANVTGRMQISVSGLSSGVYFVRLNNAEGTATQKFIKK